MKNLFVLLLVGCLFFSCKSESCQAVISIHKVYNSVELREKIESIVSEDDSAGWEILTELTKAAYNYSAEIATSDTAIVKEYIAKLNFDKPIACAFIPLNNSGESDFATLIVYELTPLISESVTLSIAPNEYQGYEALFKFADADKWERITCEYIGRQLAIAVNGIIKCALVVNEPIKGGNCSVVGSDLDDLIKSENK